MQDVSLISFRYLRGWFLLDFISSTSSILSILADNEQVAFLRGARILRLFRLLKLVRIFKLKQVFDHLDGVSTELMVLARYCACPEGTFHCVCDAKTV